MLPSEEINNPTKINLTPMIMKMLTAWGSGAKVETFKGSGSMKFTWKKLINLGSIDFDRFSVSLVILVSDDEVQITVLILSNMVPCLN